MKKLLNIMILLSLITSASYSQENKERKISYGVKAKIFSVSTDATKRIFFSYGGGLTGTYKFSDSSRTKLEAGVIYTKRNLKDTGGVECFAFCPWYTLTNYCLEFPLLLNYKILNKRVVKMRPVMKIGLMPSILLVSEKIYYEGYKSLGDESWNLFTGGSQPLKRIGDINLILGFEINLLSSKFFIVSMGIEAQVIPYKFIPDMPFYHALGFTLSGYLNK